MINCQIFEKKLKAFGYFRFDLIIRKHAAFQVMFSIVIKNNFLNILYTNLSEFPPIFKKLTKTDCFYNYI